MYAKMKCMFYQNERGYTNVFMKIEVFYILTSCLFQYHLASRGGIVTGWHEELSYSVWPFLVLYSSKYMEMQIKLPQFLQLLIRKATSLKYQYCLEEYKAEIESNVESFMETWVYVYEELKSPTTRTVSDHIYHEVYIGLLYVIYRKCFMFYVRLRSK